ncbi:Panacea domain-containing protein [Shouchella clausii]|uniref:Panacea domain-containing protein n=1 Tax=Shouchella clausii TaxID=79880 RepID=UPI00289A69EB|nr:type II toxin-antitoxin system antitoxin SocA domain-containing protein [Shouchella clausii]
MTQREYVFPSVHIVAEYLHHLKETLSPLKLQKSLYFLYAYHGAMYGNKTDQLGIIEGTSEPSGLRLFPVSFEAWKYGPVIKDVYIRDRYHGGYNRTPDDNLQAVTQVQAVPEIRMFIDELFEQIDAVSDFSLVERSHQDNSWKSCYREDSTQNLMCNDKIIEEYKERYL